ncbi:hypothetical protein GCM10009425_30500 [Pseudomonas asuensis]|uniref:Secreted protein n=1 Tax=Pseudomonas asuensis TaxID=1825787 RepID=A0ABQ2GXU7_9PSED|nr:hypothetical protein GCM10009425_30500 [Pseudomonas asuensis]
MRLAARFTLRFFRLVALERASALTGAIAEPMITSDQLLLTKSVVAKVKTSPTTWLEMGAIEQMSSLTGLTCCNDN